MSDSDFTYHSPKPGQADLYAELRNKARELAHYIADVVPPSREQSLALTKLEEMVMHANSGIARHGKAITERADRHGHLTASEALFGFMGWLTTRSEKVTFSASNNAAPAAELVDEFCKANSLPEPRDDWTTRLTHPSGEVSEK